MNLDGIALSMLVTELSTALEGGQITKIYQPNDRTLYFRIHTSCQTHHFILTLDGSPRLFLTAAPPPTPDTPTGLCMFLRKYFENGRIGTITQLHLDRIIVIDTDILDNRGKLITRKIYIELMGKYSNIIFTENGTILEALIKTRPDKDQIRPIVPKQLYELPPNHARMNPFDFTAIELLELMDTGDATLPLDKWMYATFNGMSNLFLGEVGRQTSVELEMPLNKLDLPLKKAWISELLAVKTALATQTGCWVYRSGKKSIMFPLRLHDNSLSEEKFFPTINAYLEQFEQLGQRTNAEQTNLLKTVKSLVRKQLKKIQKIGKELTETEKMSEYKLYGDLLMINAWQKAAHQTSITVQNILAEEQDDLVIILNPARSLTDNANQYYKKYIKLRNRKKMADGLIADNHDFLLYLQSVEYSLENKMTKNELNDIKNELYQMKIIKTMPRDKIKKEFTQKILTVTVDDLDIWIGKNNRQNDYLTLKKARPDDLWFHTKNVPGSHVILACHNVTPTDKQILQAAELAAWNSKGRDSSKVEVDYVSCRYIKKPNHAPPGFVIYENQQTLVVKPTDTTIKKQ